MPVSTSNEPVNNQINQLSAIARREVQAGNWPQVNAYARQILAVDKRNPEGLFLLGLTQTKSDRKRYDAGIELANQYVMLMKHTDALRMLERYEGQLSNSPLYLDMAANVYTRLGLHQRAWPLLRRANELQPGIGMFEANLAACAVLLGKVSEAREIYLRLISKNPTHQRNHYELSRLERVRDDAHVEQMKSVLDGQGLSPHQNIYLYYALGKELEDLERWDEAFEFYQRGGDAVTIVAKDYDVEQDIALIETAIEITTPDWLASGDTSSKQSRTPIFVVGLPRSGTTLTERIISSHSQVESVDETFFMQLALTNVSKVRTHQPMSPDVMRAAADRKPAELSRAYLDLVGYKLGDNPYFVEKLPENFLYLGYIARSFPGARIVLLDRNPMDSCFALYKQSFFKYAYQLEDVGKYFIAFDKLRRHWRDVLGDRLIEMSYESLVADQEPQTRRLLGSLGLEFEQACLEFDRNEAPSATASATQVREKIHSRSVANWKHFESHLAPLRHLLEDAGIQVEPVNN
jgi:hypothetical protein